MNLREGRKNNETAEHMIDQINIKYDLNQPGRRLLKKCTVYRLAREGTAGKSPIKKGPQPIIPLLLLRLLAKHIDVRQAGQGEINGSEIRQLIGAAINRTSYENKFTIRSVWEKLLMEFPESTQAATKISIEDGRAEWTTFDNLNQWLTDVKQDLIDTGLVLDRPVYDSEGNVLSELDFRGEEVLRRIVNMDETFHNLFITGDRSGPRAIIYHKPKYQRSGRCGVKNNRHVTGAYATSAAGEVLPPLYIFDSRE